MEVQPIINTSIQYLAQVRRETFLDKGPFRKQELLQEFMDSFPYGLNSLFPPTLHTVDVTA
jgi:hypothetical protein